MTIDPRTASIDEIRDWLAERDGWILEPGVEGDPVWCKREAIDKWLPHCEEHPEGAQYDHPYPLTLDGAAAAMPEGLRTERVFCPSMLRWEYRVWRQNHDPHADEWSMVCDADGWPIVIADTGNEIEDRYRLAAMARQAEQAKEAQP